MKRRFFWSVFFYCFLDCRSTNLLRLFSGNLPAMFSFSFLREREIDVKNFSLSEQNFFVHVWLLKASFLQLLIVLRFDFDIVMVLGLFR